MTAYQGKCLCGEVEWEVTLKDDQQKHVLCHCNTCKVLSGGSYTLNQIIPKSAFKFTKGEDKIKSVSYTGDSGNAVNCYYCSGCTTHPYHEQTVLPDSIILRTGLLSGSDNFEPAAEIYGKDRYTWEKEVAQTFPVLPPQ